MVVVNVLLEPLSDKDRPGWVEVILFLSVSSVGDIKAFSIKKDKRVELFGVLLANLYQITVMLGSNPVLRAYSNFNRVRRPQRGNGFDIQKWIAKTGIEFHPPGYQFLGPGTHLEKRLKRGDQGINRLDRIARQHDIDYSNAGMNIRKKCEAIDNLSGKKSWMEFASRHGINMKKKLEQLFS